MGQTRLRPTHTSYNTPVPHVGICLISEKDVDLNLSLNVFVTRFLFLVVTLNIILTMGNK